MSQTTVLSLPASDAALKKKKKKKERKIIHSNLHKQHEPRRKAQG